MAENSATGEISKETGADSTIQSNILCKPERPSSANKVAREERIRLVKTRQNEERQRKFEELRAQALAEQKLREQKEEERRKRIEELRMRDNDRRQQVEERKKQIEDAERDRREAILRKNQERDARLENKRRSERPASVFAFGSSTPRMLEPADTGGSFWAYRRAASTMNVALGGCTGPPPGRRSSERDTDGSKKRATSAGGLDRDTNEDMRSTSSMYEVFHWFSPNPINNPAYKKTDENEQGSGTQSPAVFTNRVARRRTDLMPTIPSPRDAHSMSARPFTRSPGRAYSMTRLDQLAQPRRRLTVVQSAQQNASVTTDLSHSMMHLQVAGRPLRKAEKTTSMSHLPVAPPRLNKTERLRRQQLAQTTAPPDSVQGVRSGEVTPSRPGSALSGSSSITSSVSLRHSGNRPLTAPRRPRPASIADTGLSSDFARTKQNMSSVDIKTSVQSGETLKPPLPKPRTKSAKTTPNKTSLPPKNIKRNAISTKTTPIQSPSVEVAPAIGQLAVINGVRNISENAANNVQDNNSVEILKNDRKIAVTESDVKSNEKNDIINEISAVNDLVTLETTSETPEINVEDKKSTETIETSNFETVMNLIDAELPDAIQNIENNQQQVLLTVTNNDLMTQSLKEEPVSKIDMSDEMSASMFAKTRITTEEEAKAALAERRRLAREEAERQAELERQRQEAEARAEQERLRQEEEEQRRLEEETLRLAEEQRKLEEQRLLLAIEETKKREEEEKQRLAEEARQRAEKEEQERKAREEAEKQRIEMAERLKQEEKEREARRKRVEAIMLRTRGKSAPNSQTKSDGENDDKDKTNIESTVSNPELSKENVVQNGTDSNKQKIEGDANKQTVESNTTIPVINTSVDNASIPLVEQSKQHNGDFPTNVDNIRLEQQNITNSTLIDISEFDPFKNANAPSDNVDKLSDVNSNQ